MPFAGPDQRNFDGSVLQIKETSVGCIFRGDKGDVLHIGAKRGFGSSPLLTKALVCSKASMLGFMKIHLEGDNINVINIVLSKGVGFWEINLAIMRSKLYSPIYRKCTSDMFSGK